MQAADAKCCSQEDSSASTTINSPLRPDDVEATIPPVADEWAGLCVEPGLHDGSYITAKQLLECKRRLSEIAESVRTDDSKRACQNRADS
jgi:hypothetical protein